MLTEKLLSEKQRLIKQEMQDFVKWVPRQLIIDMDQNKVKYPAEFLEEAGRRTYWDLDFHKSTVEED